MSGVCLRPVTKSSFKECIELRVAPEQRDFVASNMYSLAQAAVNPLLTCWAIYDRAVLGREIEPDDAMRGFCMVQVMDGVGFVVRLMIAERHQRQGYGRAAMRDVVRRLQLTPGIEVIGTSVSKGNEAAERLYRSLGFVENPMMDDPRESYLVLDWPEGTVDFLREHHG